jgi:hypothetical protein
VGFTPAYEVPILKSKYQRRSIIMSWFLYLISVSWISIGSCAILYTGDTRNTLKSLLSAVNRKVLSGLPLVFGVLMIVAASDSLHPWLVRVLGLLGLIKAVFVFANPKSLYEKAIQWYLESVSDQGYRLAGIITVILGTAVLSWIV